MCTLTYVPDRDGFILTSNRDEQVNRKTAMRPLRYVHSGVKIVYPKDRQAGGTWIALAENGFVLCLLNGAFEKHVHKPPYKKSRGLVLLDFFLYGNTDQYIQQYDFTGIEPFTLLIFQYSSGGNLDEIRWDGTRMYRATLNSRVPHIWSSATLYTPDVIKEREQWFKTWIFQHPRPGSTEMLQFHRFGGTGDVKNDLLMNRDNVLKTLSITSIMLTPQGGSMIYRDLLTGEDYTEELERLRRIK